MIVYKIPNALARRYARVFQPALGIGDERVVVIIDHRISACWGIEELPKKVPGLSCIACSSSLALF